MKLKDENNAVSEIIGTVLLLGFSVTFFSVIMIVITANYEGISTPSVKIVGSLKQEYIILKHSGGESLGNETTINYRINTTLYSIKANSPYLNDINQNEMWDLGEKIRYPVSISKSTHIETQVIDDTTNSAFFLATFHYSDQSSDERKGDWWNNNWSYRKNLNVTTGLFIPYHNYSGYTVRCSLDTTSDDFKDNCTDIRIISVTNSTYRELDRVIINPHTPFTTIIFRLQRNISQNSFDNQYYLYYGNPVANKGPTNKSNVYLWFDSGKTDREQQYHQGRVDSSCHGGSWGNSLSWDNNGYYTFDTGDNYVDSLRPIISQERDIYIEYEEYQTYAFPNDMTSGPLVRWIGSGSENNENSNHWYYYEIADSAYRSGRYGSHDDITANTRSSVVIDYGMLGTFPQNNWIRIGLATWDINPTHLKTFYNNQSGGWEGYRFNGTDNENENPGQFGLWIQQDQGRIRNILARRYIEPEPQVIIGAKEEGG